MRLIDADALREQILDWISEQVVSKYATHAECIKAREGARVALNILEVAPTADAVPVVRCKECGHYDTTGYPALNPGTGWCDKMGRGVHDDFYCSYGERRESEESK